MKIYLEDCLQALLAYVQGDYPRDIKYWALVALSNTITTAGKKIAPYQNNLLELF
jgi:hypothetical protein